MTCVCCCCICGTRSRLTQPNLGLLRWNPTQNFEALRTAHKFYWYFLVCEEKFFLAIAKLFLIEANFGHESSAIMCGVSGNYFDFFHIQKLIFFLQLFFSSSHTQTVHRVRIHGFMLSGCCTTEKFTGSNQFLRAKLMFFILIRKQRGHGSQRVQKRFPLVFSTIRPGICTELLV